jgi:hypothetical protein
VITRQLSLRRHLSFVTISILLLLAVAPSRAILQCGDPDLPPECGTHIYCSPIIIDVGGHGFKLTSAADGVKFDIAGTNRPIQLAWTAPDSQYSFLAIDWNHNGKIDSGRELFGNFSPQPQSATPNGFIALADLDKPQFGGNGDGLIDDRDAMFASLLLWIDSNHDGISQPNELFTLPQMGVSAIDLSFKESRRVDEFGNEFRFKSVVNGGGSAPEKIGHIAYDVLLTATAQ